MLATCLAQGMSGTPTIPARVMNRDTQALLDTGSVVTLLRPDLAGGKVGGPMEVACVHGDTRTYGTCHVVVRTPYGVHCPGGDCSPTSGTAPGWEGLGSARSGSQGPPTGTKDT